MAQKNTYKTEEEEVSYWKTSMDAVMGLLFIVLLILVLLAMWLVNPEVDDKGLADSEGTYSDAGAGFENNHAGDEDYDHDYTINNNSGGGGGSGGDKTDTSDFTGIGFSDYNGSGKCAILVMVRDAETGRLIEEKDVTFTLYNTVTGLTRLYTYYPQQIQYDDFKTTEKGQFFLPEKIMEGNYYFHEMTEPTGYDAADDTYFTVDRDYDWNEPLNVYIDLMPCQNTIPIRLTDLDAGMGVSGSQFQIIAAEDIVTMDGTTRYKKGEVADTVTTDADGRAESKLLYLGQYTIHQSATPKGYVMVDDKTVEVEKKDIKKDTTEELSTQQTMVTLTLSDELETNIKLADVTFELTSDRGDRQRGVTDENGTISFTGLDKRANYTLKQVTRSGDYQMAKDPVEFSVDVTGRIESEADLTVDLTNRTLRMEITVKDALLAHTVNGHEMTLYNMNGEIVGSWNSANKNYMFKGLDVGTYVITDNQNPNRRMEVNVIDTVDIQHETYNIWTNADTVIVIVAVVSVLLILGFAGWHFYKKRNMRKDTDG